MKLVLQLAWLKFSRGAFPSRALAAGALALLCSAASLPQRAARTGSRLRSTAILEIAGNGHARLVPIVIKVGEKYFDAGAYRADPRPMALDPGTVYEATRTGDSVGLFTVTAAQEAKGVWIGLGRWRPNGAPEPERKKEKSPPPPSSEDERPTLKNSKPAAPEAGPAPAPAESKSNAEAAKPGSAPPAEATGGARKETEEERNRPVLRRGKPAAAQPSDETPPEISEKPGTAHSTPGAASAAGATPGAVEVLAAVSDANGPAPRPYLMSLGPEEQKRDASAVRKLAYDAVLKFAATRPHHKPARASELAVAGFAVYDLHYNNEPELMLTGALPELVPAGGANTSFRYYVTVVAHTDMYGDTLPLFTQVTDSEHLDAYPRMELIDVVDAEGTGDGQLLFREISDAGYKYVIYRAGMDKLWPLYESEEKSGQ
jgi:hypothetical protein